MTQHIPYKEFCCDPAVHPATCNWGLRSLFLLEEGRLGKGGGGVLEIYFVVNKKQERSFEKAY